MDLINGELELFFIKDGETVQEMYDRLMVLVSDVRALGSKDWDDSKVTKKLLRAFAPKDTWRPHRRRPFVLVLHLHQYQSSRNLHLQYLVKN
jgi:hypothetical protein